MDIVKQNPLEEAIKKYPLSEPPDMTWTGIRDGKVIGIFGFVPKMEGIAEVWTILTKDVLDFKIEIYRRLIAVFDEKADELNLRRVEATVRVDLPKAKEMIEKLGFQQEGVMRQYTPDYCDCYLYSKLRRTIKRLI